MDRDGDVPAARQALKQILADRVQFIPEEADDGKKTYSIRGELVYNNIPNGQIGIPATNPARDSNVRWETCSAQSAVRSPGTIMETWFSSSLNRPRSPSAE